MSHDDLRLGDLLDAIPVPGHESDFWDSLETRLDAIDAAADSDVVVDLPRHRTRRWGLAAAATAAALVAVVAVVVALSDDPNDTPITTDSRVSTTVPAVTTTTAAPTTTSTSAPPPAEQAVRRLVPDPDVEVAEIGPPTPPAGFGMPQRYDGQDGQISHDFELTLYRPPEVEGVGSDAELLVLSVPEHRTGLNVNRTDFATVAVRGTTGWSDAIYHRYGLAGELAWNEAGRSFVLASRSLTTEELVEVAESLEIDGPDPVLTSRSPDLVEVATGAYPSALGPMNIFSTTQYLYESSSATSGSGGHIRIDAVPTSAEDLEIVNFFGQERSQVSVRGHPGILVTPRPGARMLAWLEDETTPVMIETNDPAVDLVAMAESPTIDPTDLPAGGAETVLTGDDHGISWELVVEPSRQHGFLMCPSVNSGHLGCQFGGVAVLPGVSGANGERFLFFGGRAPTCAVRVGLRGSPPGPTTSTRTIIGTDSHPYFVLLVPVLSASEASDPYELLREGLLAYDATGAVVATTTLTPEGWQDDAC